MNQTLRLSGGTVTRCLLGVTAFLLVANLAAQAVRTSGAAQPWYTAELARLFAVDAPYAIPAWFLAASLLFASVLCAAAAAAVQTKGPERLSGWMVLCGAAMLFSIDEIANLRHHAWSVLADAGVLNLRPFAALLFAAAFFTPLLVWSRSLDVHVRRWMISGAGLYLIGALGPPMVPALAPAHNETAMAIFANGEAFCRMVGVALFLRGAMQHLAVRAAVVQLVTGSLKRSAPLLAALFVFIALLGLVGQVFKFHSDHGRLLGFVPLFDLDAEATIPAWASSMALLASAAAALVIGAGEAGKGRRFLGWYACSAVLAWMSLDEGASVHEALSHPLQQHFDLHGLLFMAWVIPASVVLVLIGAAATPFFLRLPAATRWRLIAAAGVFLVGALVLEMIGGRYWDLHGNQNMRYHLIVFGEETLELLGISLLFRALVFHLHAVHPRAVVMFGETVRAPYRAQAVTEAPAKAW